MFWQIMFAKELLSRRRPLQEPVTGPEGGKKKGGDDYGGAGAVRRDGKGAPALA